MLLKFAGIRVGGFRTPSSLFLGGRNIYLVKNTPYCVLQSVSYSTTAAIVYAVSSVFFFFLVLFLFVVGLTPMTPCFRCTQSITQLLCLWICSYNIIVQLYEVPEEAVGEHAGGEDWLGRQRVGRQVTFSTALETAANLVVKRKPWTISKNVHLCTCVCACVCVWTVCLSATSDRRRAAMCRC